MLRVWSAIEETLAVAVAVAVAVVDADAVAVGVSAVLASDEHIRGATAGAFDARTSVRASPSCPSSIVESVIVMVETSGASRLAIFPF